MFFGILGYNYVKDLILLFYYKEDVVVFCFYGFSGKWKMRYV